MWKISSTSTPAASRASLAASMSETTRIAVAEPGGAGVRCSPNCTEQAEPGGVSCTPPGGAHAGTASERQPSRP
ncbi:hypothetical protein HCN51_21465 [Nonomuraea sp. FMUSA5-5]|uniref:Uncharacterized protein n=1 Tax=Nonomuraea composti TaxID=2720023 RepID=A0ABX1B8C1_9ACTN|nr:hypothetical protein [Nonomuraea sp. FMUSA5-5]